jgi:hypothetical protein
MKKTDVFFVIHNYNTTPLDLIELCERYVIYDASESKEYLNGIDKSKIVYVKNTGHNISSYFSFIAEWYNDLPEYMALLKGNIIGRHVSRDFFLRVYDNHYYTFLYEDKSVRDKIRKDVFFLAQENEYLEINNSWYSGSGHPVKYFNNYNNLLKFVYQDPVIPEYCLFSPGGCYIISKEQALKNSRQFYINMNKIISYSIGTKSPVEAHQIERMMNTIFTSSYRVNAWMDNDEAFDNPLSQDSCHLEWR